MGETLNIRPNPSTASKPVGALKQGALVPVFDRSGEGDYWLGLSSGGGMWIAENVDGVRYSKFYPFNESTPVEKPANVTAEMKRMVAQIEAGKQVEAPSGVTASTGLFGGNWLPIAGVAVGIAGLAWLFLRKR